MQILESEMKLKKSSPSSFLSVRDDIPIMEWFPMDSIRQKQEKKS